jgi:uncharacterized protein involved in exopolysaccharide biosynthesis
VADFMVSEDIARGDTQADEIDLWQLMLTLWEGRWLIIGVTAVCAIAAVTVAMLSEEIYRAEAVVQPRTGSRSLGGLGALAAQFGGLADIAGLSLGGSSEDRSVAIATLKSRTVVEGFIRDKNLLPKLYKKQWDAEAGKWKQSDPKRQPTVWLAYREFMKRVFNVVEDKKTGLCTVSVEWEDPLEAQQWVTGLILRTNEHLRAKAIAEGEKNLVYLEEQARKIGQVELRQSLFGLVESELRKLMLAKGGEEYAIRTIDPAVVPTERVRPKLVVISVLGFMFGGIAGVVAVLVRHGWRMSRMHRGA